MIYQHLHCHNHTSLMVKMREKNPYRHVCSMPPASSSPHSLALLYRSPEEKQSRVSRRFRSFFERRSNPKNGHICICRLYDSALNGVCATSPSFNDNHHLYLQSSNMNAFPPVLAMAMAAGLLAFYA